MPPAGTGPGLLSGSDLPTTTLRSGTRAQRGHLSSLGAVNASQPLFAGQRPGGPAYAIAR